MNPPFSLVDRFGSGLTPLAPAEPVAGGFSGATVLKVGCRDGTYGVRGWLRYSEPSWLRSLHRLLRHVAGQGVPVAVPLVVRTGDTLVRAEERWWQVEPWLPGRADFRESPSDAKLESAMATLAAFHRAAVTFEPRPEEEKSFGGPVFGESPALWHRLYLMRQRVLGGERRMIEPHLPANDDDFSRLARRAIASFDRVGERVYEEMRAIVSVKVPLLPVIRDVWREHVLFTGDAVTGLIDLSAASRDTVACDLSRLLGSLLGDDPPRWDAAIAAYQRHRPLSLDEAALIPVLDRSNVLLSATMWLRRRYLSKEPCDGPAVVARLRECVERMERM